LDITVITKKSDDGGGYIKLMKVNVVKNDKNSEPVKAGQVRKSVYGYYGLIIMDENEDFNVIKLTNEDQDSIISQFETVYSNFIPARAIESDFPEIVEAELTIKARES
jgi:hypothetical protein